VARAIRSDIAIIGGAGHRNAMKTGQGVAISMIMPNYNGARYLAKSIDAFLRQNHDNKELLIVDGKSTDGSHDIIARLCENNPELQWLKYEDRGISDATNFAIKRAKGEVIGYIGCDDILLNGVLTKVDELASYIDFDGLFFKSFTYYVRERRCVVQKPVTTEITTANLLQHGTIVGGQNTFYRRRVFDQIQFNPENKYSMDYELLLELARRNAFFVYADEFCSINYFDGNLSHNNPLQSMEAVEVTLRFAEDFDGALWCEPMLAEKTGWQTQLARNIRRRSKNLLRRAARRLLRLRSQR
jgi:glycosyltransferase involved in cell wall biosynthesis